LCNKLLMSCAIVRYILEGTETEGRFIIVFISCNLPVCCQVIELELNYLDLSQWD